MRPKGESWRNSSLAEAGASAAAEQGTWPVWSLVTSPAAMPSAGPGAGSCTCGVGCPVGVWLPCVGWGEGAREDLQRAALAGRGLQRELAFCMDSPHLCTRSIDHFIPIIKMIRKHPKGSKWQTHILDTWSYPQWSGGEKPALAVSIFMLHN